jgi:hypothetical protein
MVLVCVQWRKAVAFDGVMACSVCTLRSFTLLRAGYMMLSTARSAYILSSSSWIWTWRSSWTLARSLLRIPLWLRWEAQNMIVCNCESTPCFCSVPHIDKLEVGSCIYWLLIWYMLAQLVMLFLELNLQRNNGNVELKSNLTKEQLKVVELRPI